MRRRGFTLIELLVVIAIIAILAAILFPVFAKAREKARQTSCLSNMKQVSLAFQMYATDWDERLPLWRYTYGARPSPPECGRPTWSSCYGWPVLIQPYIRSRGLFSCPSWGTWRTNLVGFGPPRFRFSYSSPRGTRIHWPKTATNQCQVCSRICASRMNKLAYHGNGWNNSRRLADFEAPANLVVLMEWSIGHPRRPRIHGFHAYWRNKFSGPGNMWKHPHNDGDNYAFWDGHAKWLNTPDVGLFTKCASDDQ